MAEKKPPPAARLLPRRAGTLPQRPEEDERIRTRRGVQEFLDELESRNLVGARGLKFGDLLASEKLRIVPAGLIDGLGESNEHDVPSYLAQCLSRQPGRRFLVLAPPGVGKSTCSLLLYHALATRFLSSEDARPPVHLDLKLFRRDIAESDFASRAWLDRECAARLGQDTSADGDHALLILDSMDEMFAGSDFDEFHNAATRHLFQHAHVIFCRSHFFEQAGRFAPAIAERDIIQLQPWDAASVDRYVHALYARLSPSDAAAAQGFLDWIHSSSALNAVVQIPIRLNMALDVYRGPQDVRPREATLLKLYEAYVTTGIKREKTHRLIGFDKMFRILMEIAWEGYLEGGSGQADRPPMHEADVKSIIRTVSALEEPEVVRLYDAVMNLGVLEHGTETLLVRNPDVQFSHKSFQEYLVATRVQQAFTSSAADTARMFASHLNPEVSEFIKEAIDETNLRPKEQRAASAIIQQALLDYRTLESARELGIQDERFRLMREQLCYYLGNLELEKAHAFLAEQMLNEADQWVRRGIAVGLAFGGIDGPLAAYLKELADERTGPPPHPKNDANIGFHLAFFGDQPFDPADPEKDFGFPECSRTVARLSYQLTTRTNRPNWQIDLYTLLDLRHRAVSLASYERAWADSLPSLLIALKCLEADPAASGWTETVRLRQELAGKLLS